MRHKTARPLAAVFVLSVVAASLAACTTVEGGPGIPAAPSASSSAALRQKVDEMRYLRGQELLARMTMLASLGSDSVPAVTEGAKSDDWLVRTSCMWIFEAMGDRRNIPVVHDALDDDVPVVRYQAAATLVKLGDRRGLRRLVEGLSDADLQTRYKCFQALRGNTGKDFGYRHDASPEDRQPAVARWREWLASAESQAL